MRCKHNAEVECDVFDDTQDCWYDFKWQCDEQKHRRELDELKRKVEDLST